MIQTAALKLVASGSLLFSPSSELIQQEKVQNTYGLCETVKMDSLQSIPEAIEKIQTVANLQLVIIRGHGNEQELQITKEMSLSPNFPTHLFSGLPKGIQVFLIMCCPGENLLAKQIAKTAGVYVSCIEHSPLFMPQTFFLRNDEGKLEFRTLDANNIDRTVVYNPEGNREPVLSQDLTIERAAEQGYPYSLFSLDNNANELQHLADRLIKLKHGDGLYELASYMDNPLYPEQAAELGSLYAQALLLSFDIKEKIDQYEPIWGDAAYLHSNEKLMDAFFAVTKKPIPDYLFIRASLPYFANQQPNRKLEKFCETKPQYAFQLGLIYRDVFKNPSAAKEWFQKTIQLEIDAGRTCEPATRELILTDRMMAEQ